MKDSKYIASRMTPSPSSHPGEVHDLVQSNGIDAELDLSYLYNECKDASSMQFIFLEAVLHLGCGMPKAVARCKRSIGSMEVLVWWCGKKGWTLDGGRWTVDLVLESWPPRTETRFRLWPRPVRPSRYLRET